MNERDLKLFIQAISKGAGLNNRNNVMSSVSIYIHRERKRMRFSSLCNLKQSHGKYLSAQSSLKSLMEHNTRIFIPTNKKYCLH